MAPARSRNDRWFLSRFVLDPVLAVVAWFGSRPWRFAALGGLLLLSTWALFRAEDAFTSASGFATLDTQNSLTYPQAVQQISAYDGPAITAYALFAVIDYVFPLVASVVLAVIARWFIILIARSSGPIVPPRMCLVFLLPAMFDYVENVSFSIAVATDGWPVALRIGLAAKALKLASLGLAPVLLALLAATATAFFVRHRHRSNRL